jgi:hypothetical protein
LVRSTHSASLTCHTGSCSQVWRGAANICLSLRLLMASADNAGDCHPDVADDISRIFEESVYGDDHFAPTSSGVGVTRRRRNEFSAAFMRGFAQRWLFEQALSTKFGRTVRLSRITISNSQICETIIVSQCQIYDQYPKHPSKKSLDSGSE